MSLKSLSMRVSRTLLTALTIGGFLSLCGLGYGQIILPAVVEPQDVPGVGLVTSISNMAINDDGFWVVEADTDAATDFDSVLIRDGSLFWREGDALQSPSGATIDSFDSVTINDLGQHGFNFFLDGAVMSGMDSGVYAYLDPGLGPFDGTVLTIQEGENTPDFVDTPLTGLFDVKINNSGQLMVVATSDDPLIPSSSDRVLTVLTSDPSVGGVTSSTLIAVEGDVLPGQVEGLTDFGTSPHETAFNDAGSVLFAVDIPGADAIYRFDAGVLSIVAQEGDPSPVAGRSWSSLTSVSLDLNNFGEFVFRGTLDGDTASNSVLIKNGDTFRQEGDPAPGGFAFTSFGSGPVEVSDQGDVLWYGDWDDPNTDVDTGLFLNDDLIVQEGVTEISGFGVIDTIRGVEDGYHMSASGNFIIFEAILDNGDEGAFILESGGGPVGPSFIRGDSNADGGFDISDAIFTLAALFTPGSASWSCDDSGDANDDGLLNIADAIATLAVLFSPGTPPLPAPTTCGEDLSPDSLDCVGFGACP